MFVEILRVWSVIFGISVVLWHSVHIARSYGWNIGKKAFYLQYSSVMKGPKSDKYPL